LPLWCNDPYHCSDILRRWFIRAGTLRLRQPSAWVGAVVVILSATLVFIPIPMSNVVPALVIALISLAYLEEDGVLLSIALLAAVIVLTVATAAVWEAIAGAKWIIKLW
jgi:hypothetical protein